MSCGNVGSSVEPQHEIPVYYDGVVVGQFFADILVEKTVIVELKAAKDDNEVFVAQCLDYLKATGLPICLLLNFGKPRSKSNAYEDRQPCFALNFLICIICVLSVFICG